MRVFFSTDYINDKVLNGAEYGIHVSPGWSNFTSQVVKLLEEQVELTDDYREADLELYVGQPCYYRKPQLRPAVFISMFEKYELLDGWVDALNNFDLVYNTSTWGVKSFKDSGVKNVKYLKPPIAINDYEYKKRPPTEEHFRVLTQIAKVSDRKGSQLMYSLYQMNKMPGTLIIKSCPNEHEQRISGYVSKNIALVQRFMPTDEYHEFLDGIHLSVNPTRGEGIGLMPIEHTLSGIPTIVPDYSACHDFIDYMIPVKYTDTTSTARGYDIQVNTNDLKRVIKKAYSNYAKIEEEAITNAKRLREFLTPYQDIRGDLRELIKDVPRQVQPYNAVETTFNLIDDMIGNSKQQYRSRL